MRLGRELLMGRALYYMKLRVSLFSDNNFTSNKFTGLVSCQTETAILYVNEKKGEVLARFELATFCV